MSLDGRRPGVSPGPSLHSWTHRARQLEKQRPSQLADWVPAGLCVLLTLGDFRLGYGPRGLVSVLVSVGGVAMKRLISSLAALGALLLMAMPAQASGAGAVTFTQTFHNFTQTFSPPDPMASNPCTGVPGTLTLTYNGVMHATFLTSGVGAGTGWVTFTGTGDFTLAQVDGVTFTGHFTAWDGASFNLKNLAATGILVIHGTGTDGSSLTVHAVMHVTVLLGPPPSLVVSFSKFTCG